MVRQELNIRQTPEGLFFYLDGCLQFASADEHIYHEMLVHPAAGILRQRRPHSWRALILGGGDGLALREILKYECCGAVDLADHDPEVIKHAERDFSGLNQNAFADPRVRVFIEDARSFLQRGTDTGYDLIVSDFTFPCTLEAARLFTADFFRQLRQRLHPQGLCSLNLFSPSSHALAYWSVFNTLRQIDLHPCPLHVSIPSFQHHGYGEWGFMTASPAAVRAQEFAGWLPPPAAKFIRHGRLLDSLTFQANAVQAGLRMGSGSVRSPAELLRLLRTPVLVLSEIRAAVDFAQDDPLAHLAAIESSCPLPADQEWLRSLVAILRSMDLERLFAEAERRMHTLSAALQEKFRQLRQELPQLLKEHVVSIERIGQLLSVLMLLLMTVNLLYPDNAFAKGSYGSHSSSGGGTELHLSLLAPAPATPFHCQTLQTANPVYAVDMKCKNYLKKRLANREGGDGEELFYAVSDEIFLTPSGQAWLRPARLTSFLYRIKADGFELIREEDGKFLMNFLPEQDITAALLDNLALQSKALARTLGDYQKWLAWASPMQPYSEGIRNETCEQAHLRKIQAALTAASAQLEPLRQVQAVSGPPLFRLAPGVYLDRDSRVLLQRADGQWFVYPAQGKFADARDLPISETNPALEAFIDQVLTGAFAAHPQLKAVYGQ